MKKIKKYFYIFSLLSITSCASFPKLTIENTISSNQCNIEIQKLQNLSMNRNNSKFGFVYNQTCIAIKACYDNNNINDISWRDKVITHFVDAYIYKFGDWNEIENSCQAYNKFNPIKNLLCQRKMALHHIRKDLPNSLNYAGCGSQNDWQIMEKLIKDCINQAHYTPFISIYVQKTIIKERNLIRNMCLTNHQ